MHIPDHRPLRAAAVASAVALLVAGCDTGPPSPSTQPGGSGETQAPPSMAAEAPADLSGGTIYILSSADGWAHLDPQRVYGGADLAFLGATIHRSLVTYRHSPDAAVAYLLEPDLATDTGTASADARTWTFTLRDGPKWQDGSPISCADVAYGISRTFATDVITGGPAYQVQYLDIPTNDNGTSQYPGPYKATPAQQALYDKAVACNGNTITFKLNQPVADFNYITTLGFNPVPRAADTGETYGDHVVSSGPYVIESYHPGRGGRMILVRNPNWDQASDPVRKAYPDQWEVDFGLDSKVIDQRLIESSGNDAFAISYGDLQPESMTTVFADPQTPNPEFEGRAVGALGPYALYYFIDVQKVPNVKIRQAMAVALDRAAIRLSAGGAFAGDLGDGLISPSLGDLYAPTGMWDGLLGQTIPDSGDPGYAKQLLREAGEAAPHLSWVYPSPRQDKEAAIVKDSLEKAGFQVDLNPVPQGEYFMSLLVAPTYDFGWGAWGPDWPNASTIIPPLTMPPSEWNASHVCVPACSAADDPDWLARIDAALAELDHATQASLWQDLNKEAMRRVFAIPITFVRTQVLAGTSVKPVYQWAPYGCWPFGEMYVVKT